MKTAEMIEKLIQTPEFQEKFAEATTAEEVVALFAQYDVVLSEQQVMDMMNAVVADQTEGDELSETALENVSGGGSAVKKLISACTKAWKFGWNLGKKFYEWEQSLYK